MALGVASLNVATCTDLLNTKRSEHAAAEADCDPKMLEVYPCPAFDIQDCLVDAAAKFAVVHTPEMRTLATLAIATLAARFPNDPYLELLEFLNLSFWQFDCLDTRETLRTKAAEVSVHTLYTPLAALIDKYSEPQTAKKRNGAMIAVPPMLPAPNASPMQAAKTLNSCKRSRLSRFLPQSGPSFPRRRR